MIDKSMMDPNTEVHKIDSFRLVTMRIYVPTSIYHKLRITLNTAVRVSISSLDFRSETGPRVAIGLNYLLKLCIVDRGRQEGLVDQVQ